MRHAYATCSSSGHLPREDRQQLIAKLHMSGTSSMEASPLAGCAHTTSSNSHARRTDAAEGGGWTHISTHTSRSDSTACSDSDGSEGLASGEQPLTDVVSGGSSCSFPDFDVEWPTQHAAFLSPSPLPLACTPLPLADEQPQQIEVDQSCADSLSPRSLEDQPLPTPLPPVPRPPRLRLPQDAAVSMEVSSPVAVATKWRWQDAPPGAAAASLTSAGSALAPARIPSTATAASAHASMAQLSPGQWRQFADRSAHVGHLPSLSVSPPRVMQAVTHPPCSMGPLAASASASPPRRSLLNVPPPSRPLAGAGFGRPVPVLPPHPHPGTAAPSALERMQLRQEQRSMAVSVAPLPPMPMPPPMQQQGQSRAHALTLSVPLAAAAAGNTSAPRSPLTLPAAGQLPPRAQLDGSGGYEPHPQSHTTHQSHLHSYPRSAPRRQPRLFLFSAREVAHSGAFHLPSGLLVAAIDVHISDGEPSQSCEVTEADIVEPVQTQTQSHSQGRTPVSPPRRPVDWSQLACHVSQLARLLQLGRLELTPANARHIDSLEAMDTSEALWGGLGTAVHVELLRARLDVFADVNRLIPLLTTMIQRACEVDTGGAMDDFDSDTDLDDDSDTDTAPHPSATSSAKTSAVQAGLRVLLELTSYSQSRCCALGLARPEAEALERFGLAHEAFHMSAGLPTLDRLFAWLLKQGEVDSSHVSTAGSHRTTLSLLVLLLRQVTLVPPPLLASQMCRDRLTEVTEPEQQAGTLCLYGTEPGLDIFASTHLHSHILTLMQRSQTSSVSVTVSGGVGSASHRCDDLLDQLVSLLVDVLAAVLAASTALILAAPDAATSSPSADPAPLLPTPHSARTRMLCMHQYVRQRGTKLLYHLYCRQASLIRGVGSPTAVSLTTSSDAALQTACWRALAAITATEHAGRD